jgi:hypothetical protein
MASEPSAKAGPNEAEETAPLPTSAEDRKAAAALSKLDTRGEDESAAPAKEVDADALGKAMQNLSVAEGGEQADADRKKKTAEENKKKVKVDAVDVTLLVSDISGRESNSRLTR